MAESYSDIRKRYGLNDSQPAANPEKRSENVSGYSAIRDSHIQGALNDKKSYNNAVGAIREYYKMPQSVSERDPYLDYDVYGANLRMEELDKQAAGIKSSISRGRNLSGRSRTGHSYATSTNPRSSNYKPREADPMAIALAKLTSEKTGMQQDIWKAERAQALDKYESSSSNPDYKKYVAEGTSLVNPSAVPETVGDVNALFFGKVVNKATFAREAASKGPQPMYNLSPEYQLYGFMTNDEVDTYSYTLAKYGETEADKYLDALEFRLTKRRAGANAENQKKMVEDSTGGAIFANAASVLATPMKGAGAVYAVVENAIGKEVNPYSQYFDTARMVNTVRGTTSEIISKSGDGWFAKEALPFAYQTGMGVLDNALLIATGMPQAAILTAMGTGAASDTMIEAFDRGATQSQAVGLGVAAGIAEVLFEKISLDSVIKMSQSRTAASLLKNLLKQSGIEASEEVCTEIANIVSDIAIMSEKSSYNVAVQHYMAEGHMTQDQAEKKAFLDLLGQVGLAGLGGMLSGGMMGTGATAIANYNMGQDLKRSGAGQGLVDAALTTDQDSKAYKMALEMSAKQQDGTYKAKDNLSGGKLRRLSAANTTAINAQTMAEVNATVDGSKNAAAISKVFNKIINGNGVSAYDAALIRGDQQASELFSRMFDVKTENLTDSDMITIAENRGYGAQLTPSVTTPAAGEKTALWGVSTGESGNAGVSGSAAYTVPSENAAREGYTFFTVGEDTSIKTPDGTAVPVANVQFSSPAVEHIYQSAAKLDNPAAANAMVGSYEGGDAVAYAKAFSAIYRSAKVGLSYQQAVGASLYAQEYLSESQRAAAYEAGSSTRIANEVRARQVNAENRARSIQAAHEQGKSNMRQEARGEYKPGVNREYSDQLLTPEQRKQLRVIDEIFKAAGKKIIIHDKIGEQDGQIVYNRSGGNAYYDPKTDTYHLSLDAVGQAYAFVTVHESIHEMRAKNADGYDLLRDIVTASLEGNLMNRGMTAEEARVEIERMVRHQADLNGFYTEKGGQRAYSEDNLDDAMEEVIANTVPVILTDETQARRFADKVKRAGNDIRAWFEQLLKDLVDILDKAYSALSKEQSWKQMELIREDKNAIQMIADAYFDGMEGANGSVADAVSTKFSLNPDFVDEYDAWDGKDAKGYFVVGTTSEALQSIGIDPKNIEWDKGKIIKIKEKHPGMTDEVIKQVPTILEYPILILKSKQKDSRVVLFGEIFDANNIPVLAVLELQPKANQKFAFDVIKIASAYGKDTNPQKLIDESEILYVEPDKNRTDSWLKGTRLQLPFDLKHYGSINKIAYSDASVNPSIRENSKKDAKHSLRDLTLSPSLPYTTVQGNSKDAQLFAQAKQGDELAAGKLVQRNATAIVNRVREQYSGMTPVIIGGTDNAVPRALAAYLQRKADLNECAEIGMEANAKKKDYPYFERLFVKSEFSGGESLSGRNVVLVDDVLTTGGTVAELATYLQSLGANVKGVVTLFHGKNATKALGVTAGQIDKIERLIGRDVVEGTLSRSLEDLSYAEAETVLVNQENFREADQVGMKFSIKDGMTEEERYAELKDARLNAAAYDGDTSKLTPAEVTRLENATRRDARRYVKTLYEKFGVGKRYANQAAEIEFEFSKNDFDESINKQTARTADYANFGKMLASFDAIIGNAVPLEIHTDKYVGTKRENSDLKRTYVLISAYWDNGIVPVQLEVKEFIERENSLYVAITLSKIKDTVFASGSASQETFAEAVRIFDISLREMFENINPSDGEFLKYVPDGFLNEEQKAAKLLALEKEQRKIEGYRFSLKDVTPADTELIQADNEGYSGTENTIKQQLSMGLSYDEKAVGSVARAILKQYNSAYDLSSLTDDLGRIFSYLSGKNVAYAEARDVGTGLMKKVLAESRSLDASTYEATKPVRDYLRNTGITLSEKQKAEAAAVYDGYGTYHRSLFGKVKLVNDGLPLDTAWRELAEMGWVDANTTEGDQVTGLMELASSVQKTYINEYGYDTDGYAYDMFLQAVYEYMVRKGNNRYVSKLHEQINAIRAEEKAKYQKRIADIRAKSGERYDKKLGEAKAQYRDRLAGYKQKQEERGQKAKYKKSIETKAKEMVKWLSSPNLKEGKYVPDALRGPVLHFLQNIDFTGSRGGKVKQTLWYNSIVNLRNEYNRYAAVKRGPEDYDIMQVADDFGIVLDDLSDSVAKAKYREVNQLNATELEELDYIIKNLRSAIRNANRTFRNRRFATAAGLGDSVLEYAGSRAGKEYRYLRMGQAFKDFMNVDMLDSYSFFDQFGEAGKSLSKELDEGMQKSFSRVRQASEFMESLKGEFKISAGDINGWNSEIHEFVLTSGEKVVLSTTQIMDMYNLNLRKQAQQHLLGGGVEISEIKSEKGSKIRQRGTFGLAESDVSNITGALTDQQRGVCDALMRYLSEECSAWGNEVTQERYGVDSYRETRYWPIRSSSSVLKTEDPDAVRAFNALANSSFTKATNKYANNSIRIDDVFQVFSDHVAQMAQYNGLALPIDDLMKWINYQQRNEEGKDIRDANTKNAIERIAGKKAKAYLVNLVKDINGLSSSSYSTALPSKLMSNFKRSAVAGRLRVVIQQPTAIGRALAMIDGKYLIKATLRKHSIKEMQDNAPVAWWKAQGNYEIGVGRSLRSVIVGDDTGMMRLTNAAMAPAGFADDITWSHIWEAVKLEVKDRNSDLSQDAFMAAVVDRFSDIVNRTQVVDSVLHRSQAMRSKDLGVRQATAFMSEPTKSYNMLRSAIMEVVNGKDRKKAGKLLVRTTMAWLLSQVLNAVVLALHDTFRDRDEEDEFADMFLEKFVNESLDNINPFGMIPFMKEIVSLVQGYESSTMTMNAFSDLWRAVSGIYDQITGDSKRSLYYTVSSSAKAISNALGLPFDGMMASLETIVNGVAPGALPDKKPTAKDYSNKIYNASMDGDLEKRRKLYDEAVEAAIASISESEQARIAEGKNPLYSDSASVKAAARRNVETGIANVLKDYHDIATAYEYRKNGYVNKLDAVYRELKSLGFSHNEITYAINYYENAVTAGKTGSKTYKEENPYTEETFFAAASRAAKSGSYSEFDTVHKAMIKYSGAQDPDASVKSRLMGYIKDETQSGRLSAAQAKNMLIRYGGYSGEDADAKVAAYEFFKDYPEYDGEISQEAIAEYNELCQPAGVTAKTYYSVYTFAGETKADVDSNGKAISGSKKEKVMAYINSLNIPNGQKDALYYACDYAKSTINEAPWH